MTFLKVCQETLDKKFRRGGREGGKERGGQRLGGGSYHLFQGLGRFDPRLFGEHALGFSLLDHLPSLIHLAPFALKLLPSLLSPLLLLLPLLLSRLLRVSVTS